MRKLVLALLVPASLLAAGCAESGSPTDLFPAPIPSTSPAAGRDPEFNSSTGAGRATPAPVPAESDKDKPRGNTPLGTDRTGAGPADGAIRDPAGVVTKQPEPKAIQ